FTVYNGAITSVGPITSVVSGNITSKRVTVSGTTAAGASAEDVIVLFGAHNAQACSWGAGQGANSWPGGASGKMSFDSFSGAPGTTGQISFNPDNGSNISPIGLSINNQSVNEGNSGLTLVTLTVSICQTTNVDIFVDWTTANGTALAGSDFIGASGSGASALKIPA